MDDVDIVWITDRGLVVVSNRIILGSIFSPLGLSFLFVLRSSKFIGIVKLVSMCAWTG